MLRLVGSSPQGPGVLITNKDFYARVRLKAEVQEASWNEVPMLYFGFRKGMLINQHQKTCF